MNDEIMYEMSKAVSYQTGNIAADANIKSNNNYNNIITLYAKFDGDVNMDRQKVGKLLTPEIMKTLKSGGVV